MYVYLLREHHGGELNGKVVSVHANPAKIMDEISVIWVRENCYPPKYWGTPDAVAIADDPGQADAHYTLQAYGVN